MQSKNDRINDTIETTIKNLTDLVDVNTVIGTAITMKEGEMVIPFSKVTLGLLSGGGEYGKVNLFSKNSNLPYSAGNGAIVSIKPCGFLICDNNGYRIISVSNSPYEKLFEKASEFIERFKKEDK